MRLHTILLSVAAALLYSSPARATDAPPAPVPAAPAPAPAPAPEPVPAPKAARRPEDEETAGLFARLRAYAKGTGAMADEVATLRAENEALQARVGELESGRELAALRTENAAMRADIQAFITHAQTHGLNVTAAIPQSPAGLAAGAAVASAVSNQLASLGVPVASLPDATLSASATLTNLADIEAGLAACKTPEEKQAFLTKHKDAILKA